MPITTERVIEDLRQLVAARGPAGQEGEVDAICTRRLEDSCDDVSIDSMGNVIGLIRGTSREPGIKVLAHKDEIALRVKRIEGDGRLCVRRLGMMTYRRFGDGPMEVLTDDGEAIPGVLGLGPRHASENPAEPRDGSDPKLSMARLNTGLSKEELLRRGVHPGSLAVIAGRRRELFLFADCVGTHFLDDRGAIALMLAAGDQVRQDGPPPCDVHLICTTMEETGSAGAAWAVRNVPGEIVLALEIAPAAPEYEIPLDATPVVFVRDGATPYTHSVWKALAAAGEAGGTGYRYAAIERLGSDASVCFKLGIAAQIGCLGFPTDNTHGFEVCRPEALTNCAKLLAAYLQSGGKGQA